MSNRDASSVSNKEGKPDTVRLISSDGFVFLIDRKCASVSGTIRNMLEGPGS